MSNNLASIRKAREEKQEREITVSLNTLILSHGALQALAAQPLPARQAFEFAKTIKAINSEIEVYETTRKALCERFSEGKTKEDGKQYDIPAEKLADFEKEQSDLVASEVTLPIQTISIDSLGSITVSAGHILQLEWLISG